MENAIRLDGIKNIFTPFQRHLEGVEYISIQVTNSAIKHDVRHDDIWATPLLSFHTIYFHHLSYHTKFMRLLPYLVGPCYKWCVAQAPNAFTGSLTMLILESFVGSCKENYGFRRIYTKSPKYFSYLNYHTQK